MVVHLLRPPYIATGLDALVLGSSVLSHGRLKQTLLLGRVVIHEWVVGFGKRAVIPVGGRRESGAAAGGYGRVGEGRADGVGALKRRLVVVNHIPLFGRTLELAETRVELRRWGCRWRESARVRLGHWNGREELRRVLKSRAGQLRGCLRHLNGRDDGRVELV